MGFRGSKYTWCNGREGEQWVKERLDRAIVSEDWRELYPKKQVFYEVAVGSDHTSLILYTEYEEIKGKRKLKLEKS